MSLTAQNLLPSLNTSFPLFSQNTSRIQNSLKTHYTPLFISLKGSPQFVSLPTFCHKASYTRCCSVRDFADEGTLSPKNDSIAEISSVFLEESESCPRDKGSDENRQIFDFLKLHHQGVAMVGLEAMQDANSTLEEFCRLYFMFHDMDVNKPESVFRFLPILSFTESYIYELDKLNETILSLPDEKVEDLEKDSHMILKKSWDNLLIIQFKANPFKPLAHLFEHNQLLTERIREEFKRGDEYWTLERKLCTALARDEKISIEDVMRAMDLRSSDFRVLNLLLYHLRREEVNELHMQFHSVSEFLAEISDDLFDYENDVMENTFNILRMFVRIYGASAAPSMLAKCITEAEEKYEQLLRALGPQLADKYQKRCEEATEEGKITRPSLGKWIIPPVIQDEDSYRSKLSKSK